MTVQHSMWQQSRWTTQSFSPTGKRSKDVVIADSTGQTTLTLWEKDVGMTIQGKSYQLNRIQVHHYLGTTALTYPRFGATARAGANSLLGQVFKWPLCAASKSPNACTCSHKHVRVGVIIMYSLKTLPDCIATDILLTNCSDPFPLPGEKINTRPPTHGR